MFCTECGSALDDDALFCDNCGSKVENSRPIKEPVILPNLIKEKSNDKICPYCNSKLEEDCLFCTECGKKLLRKEAIHSESESIYDYVKENNPDETHTENSETIPKTADKTENREEKTKSELDFSKFIIFITEYVKSPASAIESTHQNKDHLSVIICAVLYIVTGTLIQIPLMKNAYFGGKFTFIFSFLFSIFALAMPIAISTLSGIFNKKETNITKQVFSVILNTPFVSVFNIICILIGLISIKFWIVALVIDALIYATSMYPVVVEKLPDNDNITKWYNMFLSALCWVIVMIILVILEKAVFKFYYTPDVLYSLIY